MKRILYVDRELGCRATVAFAEGLKVLGEVCFHERLSNETVEIVRRALADTPFDAVVSHLPPSPDGSRWLSEAPFTAVAMLASEYAFYGPPFSLLGEIKTITDIPVVVYTAAGMDNLPAISWDRSGVDRVCAKTNNPAVDAQLVVKTIREAWDLYAALPPASEPRCKSDKESVWIEALVRVNGGLGLYTIGTIARMLNDMDGEMELLDAVGAIVKRSRTSQIMNMLCMETPFGARVRVRVCGDTSQQANDALCRVHRLLNSRYPAIEACKGDSA